MPDSSRDSLAQKLRDRESIALIERMTRGDSFALTALYDQTNRIVFGLVLRIVRDGALAEEVLLDVYTQVWQQASSYQPLRGGPLAWILTIARSRAIDRLRSSRWEERREPLERAEERSSQAADPEAATVSSERRQIVREAIDALSPEQKQVIELAYYSGLSHSEIARETRQPLGTVKTRVRLAMIKLSDSLGEIYNEQGN